MRRLFEEYFSRCGQKWDDSIDPLEEQKLLKWKEQLPTLAQTSIDRKYLQEKVSQIDLHVFPVAFEDKLCAITYFSYPVSKMSQADLAFVFGKCQVGRCDACLFQN